jgi:hypothetical protein
MEGHNPATEKACYYCHTVKSTLAFSRDNSHADLLKNYCRRCAALPHSTSQITEKECGYCGQTKPVSAFHRRRDMPDSYQQNCKACALSMQKEIYNRKEPLPPNFKYRWCSRCETTKSLTEFYSTKGFCKACTLKAQHKPATLARASGYAARMIDNYDYTEEQIARTDAHRLATINDPCWWCGARKDRMVWLHTVPQSQGGRDLPENLHRACFSCSAARRRLARCPACLHTAVVDGWCRRCAWNYHGS